MGIRRPGFLFILAQFMTLSGSVNLVINSKK